MTRKDYIFIVRVNDGFVICGCDKFINLGE